MRDAFKLGVALLLFSFFVISLLLHPWEGLDENPVGFTGSLNITKVWDDKGELIGVGSNKLVLLSYSGRLEILGLESWEQAYSTEDVEDAGLFSGVLAFRRGESLYYTKLDTVEPHLLKSLIENASLGFKLGNLTFFITRNPPLIRSGVRVPGNITIHVCGESCRAFLFEDGEGKPFVLRTGEGFVIGVMSMEPFYRGRILFVDASGEPVAEHMFDAGISDVTVANDTVLVSTGGVERSGTAIWRGKLYALDGKGHLLWNASIKDRALWGHLCGYAPAGVSLLADGNVYAVDYKGVLHVFNRRGKYLRAIKTPASKDLGCGDLIRNVVVSGEDSLLAWAYFDVSMEQEEKSGLCIYAPSEAIACRSLVLRPDTIAIWKNYVVLSLSSVRGDERVEVFRVGGLSRATETP